MTSTVLVLDLLRQVSIRSYAVRLLKNEADAEDVLQIVAEKLLKTPSDVQQPERYVRRAVRNAAFDYRRGATVRAGHERHSEGATEPVEHEAETRSILSELEQTVAQLPTLTGQIFRMHYIDGIAQADIAARFGIHVSNVEKRIAKARRACLRRLSTLE